AVGACLVLSRSCAAFFSSFFLGIATCILDGALQSQVAMAMQLAPKNAAQNPLTTRPSPPGSWRERSRPSAWAPPSQLANASRPAPRPTRDRACLCHASPDAPGRRVKLLTRAPTARGSEIRDIIDLY